MWIVRAEELMARTPAAEVSAVGSSFAAPKAISAHGEIQREPVLSRSSVTDFNDRKKAKRLTLGAVFSAALLLTALVGCSPSGAEDQTTTSSTSNRTTISTDRSTTSTSTPDSGTSTSTSTTIELPPIELEITDPENGLTVDTDEYFFEGTITPGATIKVGSFESPVEDGTWRIRLSLRRGSNLITFVASDDHGQETVRQVQIFYKIEDDGLKPGSP